MITRARIDEATKRQVWDLGNDVLYSLCREHPRHKKSDEIIAKIWLIGRSYAAAIERRRTEKTKASTGSRISTSDDFYEVVATEVKESGIDDWLARLPPRLASPWTDLAAPIAVHKKLTDLFRRLTKLDKRALASKYLHFHRPDLFFIYDSRAREAAWKLTPRITQIPAVGMPDTAADLEYAALVRRCQWIVDDAKQRFNVTLTPRQVDNLLLRTCADGDATARGPRG